MNDVTWNIIGEDDLARQLRAATGYVKSNGPVTVVTGAGTLPSGAIATGRAMLLPNAQEIVPHLLAFRVIDEVVRAVHAGEVGQVYGCYGSIRVPRGTEPEEVALDALLPLLALALEIVQGDVTSVWARRSSLLSEGDAWFVTINIGATILTLEAMATTDAPPPDSSELLVEVTGSDQVLRAEPFHQAVTVAPFDAPARSHGWWEDVGERLLARINELGQRPVLGSATRLQVTWEAVQESSEAGSPVTPG
jgi:hypothetical protein